jgi:hypothetical protein
MPRSRYEPDGHDGDDAGDGDSPIKPTKSDKTWGFETGEEAEAAKGRDGYEDEGYCQSRDEGQC